MNFPEDQIAEVKAMSPGIALYEENGNSYFFIPGITLPENCVPRKVDVLLCPTPRDGYPSRLFFSERIDAKKN